MRAFLVAASLSGLVCAGVGWLTSGDLASVFFLLSALLCVSVGIVGVSAAREYKLEGWPFLLITLIVLGICSECTAGSVPALWAAENVDLFPKPPLPPEWHAAAARFSLGPLIVFPLIVVLFTLLNWSRFGARKQSLDVATPPSSPTPESPSGDD